MATKVNINSFITKMWNDLDRDIDLQMILVQQRQKRNDISTLFGLGHSQTMWTSKEQWVSKMSITYKFMEWDYSVFTKVQNMVHIPTYT